MTCKDCLYFNTCFKTNKYVDVYFCNDYNNKTDYVKVVRCKDCKHFTEHTVNGKPGGYGACRYYSYSVDCCSYCSSGERKTN